jgi:sugar phosphate isomerase/epimerase
MDLQFFCPRWGSEELDWDSFCKKVKAAGYDGVEAGFPFEQKEIQQARDALHKYDLLLVGQYWQSFEKDLATHKLSYKKHLEHLATFNPIKIDAQTGKDYFSFDQNKELFDIAFNFTKETGILVAHETHRNKALFAAHVTKNFLEHIPGLRITADLSHWCNVAESFLEDQPEVLAMVPQHAIHIHARVGHTQSAQVTDPRHPEWQPALHQHLQWWKEIIYYHQRAGSPTFTITPEFGPAPYMPLEPLTCRPLANQWEVNLWMMELLKQELG